MLASRRLVLSLALLAVGGCGGGMPAADPRGGPNGDYRYPASDYAQQSPGKPGGTLRLATNVDTGSLDVHALSHTNVQWIGRLLFDNLVYLDAEGRVTPWLATSWEISPDRRTYTFHLRRDVTFSDGSRFDAEAVRANLEHMRTPATKSPLAAAYIAPYVEGRAIDAFTFEARLSQPYGPFLNVLAQSWLAMISPRQIAQAPQTIATHPIGSGPFVLERYVRQQSLTLKRRDDYRWAPDQLKHDGPAYLERVVVDIVPEPLTRYAGLASGQYQLLTEAPPQNAAAVRADPRLAFDSRIRSGAPWRGVSFNVEQEPFTDVRVRRALALAVDRDAITTSVFFGESLPTTGFLARNTRFYDPGSTRALAFDPATANRLLDEAGWTGRDGQGFRTRGGKRLGATMVSLDSPTVGPINVAIQNDLKKVGFDLKIEVLPQAAYTQRRNAAAFQAIASGVWHTNTPDALYILYHSDAITTPERIGQNTSRLRDAKLDDLLTRARRIDDEAELKRLYADAQRRLTELVPAIPLDENHSIIAYSRDIHGLLFDTSHNTPVLTAAWLEPGK